MIAYTLSSFQSISLHVLATTNQLVFCNHDLHMMLLQIAEVISEWSRSKKVTFELFQNN